MKIEKNLQLLNNLIAREIRLLPMMTSQPIPPVQSDLPDVQDLLDAIQEDQFEMYYQPIIDINEKKIAKMEALIRWNHPTQSLVSPANFIPLAEQAGLVGVLGNWTFEQVAQYADQLRSIVPIQVPISFNVSPGQINDEGASYFQKWANRVKELELPDQSLCAEITEGVMLDSINNTISTISTLRECGMSVAIDDFGTGYSSLSYLTRFNFDCLKIDRAFICNLETIPADRILVEAIVMMAKRLNFLVVAEGVETKAQLEILKSLGVVYCQGYLFSPPISQYCMTRMITEQCNKWQDKWM